MEIFKNCIQSAEIINALKNLVRTQKGFVLLSGKNGTGKTYAAKCVYNCISPYQPPYYDSDVALLINQADLNIQWQKHQADYSQTYGLAEMYKNVKLFVLDDLGTRTPSDAFFDFIYSIIDARKINNRATIITTNLNATDMREKFGDAFMSRVGSDAVFRLDHDDRRLKGMS